MTHRDDVKDKRRNRGKVAALLAMAMGVMGLTTSAEAQIDLNQFRPSELGHDGFAVSSANDQGHKRFGIQLYADWSDDSLVFEDNQGDPDSESANIVHRQLTGHAVLSLGLWDRLVIFAGLPYHFILEEDDGDDFTGTTAAGVPLPDGDGLGDVWAGLRLRLFGEEDDVFQLAIQGAINVHTATLANDNAQYRGGPDASPRIGGHPELLLGFNLGERFHLNANVGYRIRDNQVLGGAPGSNSVPLMLGDELTYGLGMIIEVVDEKLDLIFEGFGRTGLTESTGSTDFGVREESPIEALGGIKYHHPKGLHLGAGGGLGVQRGYGAPDYRVFAMLGYTMPEDEEPGEPVAGDRDGDGIADDVDQCPDEPEDVDTFEDDNGCPDPDNDGDGVLDVNDGAPMDPEDADGFQDEDGVPDPDNDGDGVLDVDDQCPNEAGDPANNGCPDPDRDGDGVPDRIDNCPDEAGTPENQGCQEKQLVEIKDDKLEILEKVYFRTNSHRIRSRSFALLNNVAAVVNNHPEIQVIRVEGHTDERGSLKYNMKLSHRRAEAVVKYLTRKGGVSADRLVAEGFGPTRPVKPGATTKEEHAANRRVEFNIVGNADSEIKQEDSGPTEDTIDR